MRPDRHSRSSESLAIVANDEGAKSGAALHFAAIA
jgi:hypothetical protein